MLRMKISHFKRLTSLHPYHHDPIHSENFSTKLSYKQSTTSKVGVIVVVIIKMRTKSTSWYEVIYFPAPYYFIGTLRRKWF